MVIIAIFNIIMNTWMILPLFLQQGFTHCFRRGEKFCLSLFHDFTHKLYSLRHGFRESWECVKFVIYWTISASNLFHNTVMEPTKWVVAESELPTCSPLEDEAELVGGWGHLKATITKENYGPKLEFPAGWGELLMLRCFVFLEQRISRIDNNIMAF